MIAATKSKKSAQFLLNYGARLFVVSKARNFSFLYRVDGRGQGQFCWKKSRPKNKQTKSKREKSGWGVSRWLPSLPGNFAIVSTYPYSYSRFQGLHLTLFSIYRNHSSKRTGYLIYILLEFWIMLDNFIQGFVSGLFTGTCAIAIYLPWIHYGNKFKSQKKFCNTRANFSIKLRFAFCCSSS